MALLIFSATHVMADSPACLISFNSGTLNVCDQRASLANDDLAYLADIQAFADSSIRIVKFDGPITRDQRQALTAAGAEILGYVPYHGYKVRMDASLDSQARSVPGVIWTGPYLPVWKVGINLANELRDGGILDHADHIDSLWVSLHRGVPGERARDLFADIPGVTPGAVGREGRDQEFILLGFERAALPAIVDALAADDDVNAIGFHWPAELMNSQGTWLHQSGVNDPQPQLPIFEQGIFGCGQITAMLDSGLHQPHCSFEDPDFGAPASDICGDGNGCPVATPDFGHRKVGLHYKWSGLPGDPGDGHGHGTFVAGNMVGNNHADLVNCDDFSTPGGLTDLDGMAPGAKLIAQEAGPGLDYLNSRGGSLYHAATVAYQNDARIHNNSWGSGCRNQQGQCIAGCQVEYRPHTRGGDQAVWEHPDLLIFAAAGNDGSACGPGATVGAPGNAKNVFSIGGTQRGANGNNMYGSSSRGPTSDRRTKPDILAQSQGNITSSVSACGTTPPIAGTSFGSPTAAGLAALVREYLQRGFYPFGVEDEIFAMPDPSAALVKAMMITGAHEIDGAGTSGDFPDQNQGWGRVLLESVLYFDGDDRRVWLHDDTEGLQTGEDDVHELTVDPGEPLVITLVWHDYPAELNAEVHIVNRLRLEVETPGGDVWTQKLTPGGGLADPNPFQSTDPGDYDDLNTVHQIRFDTPEVGTYQVRVEAIDVPMGDAQPYALAATGNLLGIGDPDFALQPIPTSVEVCAGTDAEYDIGVLSIADFEDDVTLSVDDVPAGADAGFSVNPVTPDVPATISVLTVTDTDQAAAGEYTLELIGNSSGPEFDPSMHTRDLQLRIDQALSAPQLQAPADNDEEVDYQPEFSWDTLSGAVEYRIQVATDSGFGAPEIDEIVDGTTFVPAQPLASGQTYFWRVAGVNACGDSDWSDVFEFETRIDPEIEVSPGQFTFVLEEGEDAGDTLEISNVGAAALEWEITVADRASRQVSAPRTGSVTAPTSQAGAAMTLDEALGQSLPAGLTPVTPAGSVVDCDNAPGLVIHDDGTIEAGYSGNPDVVGLVRFVDHFEPQDYPATYTAICVAFLSLGPTTLDFDIIVYADDGSGGAPGTELGSMAVSSSVPVVEPPLPPDYQPEWISFDISALDISIESGGVYIGIGWTPTAPNVFIAADLTDDRPVGFAGGHWWSDNSGLWEPIQFGGDSFADYRALFVRAVEGISANCDDPAAIDWLSVSPASGTTQPGADTPVDISVDTDGLTPGVYEAGLCIASNDPQNPLLVVPVTLTVEGDLPVADISSAPLEFSLFEDGSDVQVLDIGNIGEADLVWDIDTAEVSGTPGVPSWHGYENVPATSGFSSGGGDFAATGNLIPLGDTQMSQTEDTNVVPANSAACGAGPNHLLRRFYFDEHPEVGNPAQISSVDIGIQEGVASQTLTVNLYTLPSGTPVDTIPLNALTEIGSGSITISPSDDGSVVNVPVSATVSDTGEFDLVVEATVDEVFYIGATNTGETHPGFIMAPGCGGTTPDRIDELGPDFANTHIIMVVNAGGGGAACDDPSAVPWLSVTPDNGVTAPGDSVPVDVAVDASGMAEGLHEARLCVTTNDPFSPLVEVPVALTVHAAAPVIDVDPTSFDVNVPLDGLRIEPLVVANIGEEPLEWEIVDELVTGGAIKHPAGTVTLPQTLEPRAGAEAGLSRSPHTVGSVDHPFVAPRGDQVTITHSDSLTVQAATSLACSPDEGQTTTDNQFLRVFDLEDFDIEGDFDVTEVSFGIEVLREAPVDLTVNLYTLEGNFVYANMSLIGSATQSAAPQELTVFDIPVTGTAPAGSTLVVEVVTPDQSGSGAFFIGANGAGESAPSYLASESCGISDPVTFASIGGANVHMVMTVTGQVETAEPIDCTLPDWLEVDPMDGQVAVDDEQVVAVTFDAAGLPQATYEANLCIGSNDPTQSLIVIPVLMTPVEDGLFSDRFETP